MRFLLGLAVGLLGSAGGYFGYQHWRSQEGPCLGLCGDGTGCVAGRCEMTQASAEPKKRRPRRRRRRRRQDPATVADQPALKQPSAADRRVAAKGPGLQGTDYLDMSDDRDVPELSEDAVERRVRRLDPQVIGCIDRAREGWALDSGRVVVAFRIERSGSVRKVKVTAPAVLIRQGLHDCIAGLIRQLNFPRSSRSLIMSYPYTLD